MRKGEECCQKCNEMFWRNQKNGCSLAHTLFMCIHFPLYWEVMWVQEPSDCAHSYCFTKKPPAYVPSEPSCLWFGVQAGQLKLLTSHVTVRGTASCGGLVPGKGSERNMSLYNCLGGTV